MAIDERTKELVAIGAAVAGNCIPCLQWHFKKCKELEISDEDIIQAIETARVVKDVPINKIDDLIEKFTSNQV